MDAKTLYRQGVIAIRDERDAARGRALLLESLEQNANNDMAWLWLTRTVTDRATRLEYVERALRLNPANEQAQRLKARLLGTAAPTLDAPTPPAPSAPAPHVAPFIEDAPPAAPTALIPEPDTVSPRSPVIRPLGPKTVDMPVSQPERERIAQMMDRADIYLEAGDVEQAVEQWVAVLKIRVDHELALRNAAGHLWRLGYRDDARELVQHAIDANSSVPTVYLTAIDMAERISDYATADAIRDRIARMPQSDEQLVVKIAEFYAGRYQTDQAIAFLERATATHPTSQPILLKLGELLQETNRRQDALNVLDQAVRLGSRTKAGKEADKKLSTFVPVLTDRERGNVWLAVRETVGLAALYVLLGWQDAGLNLLDLGVRRWVGVLLSMIGGYFLITATSSPQQKPVAGWLGGDVPPPRPPRDPNDDRPPILAPGRAFEDPTNLPIVPPGTRYALGVAGGLLLVLAFMLVFSFSLDQVFTHKPPYLPW